MSKEKTLRAYLCTYWPEAGPFSKRTTINYGIIEAKFDEDKLFDENLRYGFHYEDIGTIIVGLNIDQVKKRTIEVNTEVRNELKKAGRSNLEEKLDECTVKIDDLSKLDLAIKRSCTALIERYAESQKTKESNLN